MARCRCHIQLGKFRAALKDADCVMDMEDENASVPGFDEDGAVAAEAALLKAEALFHLGNFETAAIWFHRGGRARDGLCLTDQQEMRAGVAKCSNAIMNAFEMKPEVQSQRCSAGIFAFPELPQFLDDIYEKLGGGGDIAKILRIESGEHRAKRRVAGMTLGGRRKTATKKTGSAAREEENCTVYANANFGPAANGAKDGGATERSFEHFLLKRRNLVAEMTARFQAFMRGKGAKDEVTWRRPRRRRDKALCREVDAVVVARPIATDRKFLKNLVDKDCSDIAEETRYSSVINEALRFISERERFWKQHEVRRRRPDAVRKSMRAAEAAAAAQV